MRSENKILRPFYNLIVAVNRRKKKGVGDSFPPSPLPRTSISLPPDCEVDLTGRRQRLQSPAQ